MQRLTPCLVLMLGLGLFGCSTSYRPSAHAGGFDPAPTREIDDDDIAKAFAAKPQLPDAIRVAYFSFDDERTADIQSVLEGLDGVDSVYRIPPLLVDGRRRLESPPRHPVQAPEPTSVKKLRLLAARARADVLVVVDAGYRQASVNGLVALNALILPIFFTPWLDHHTESYLEAFVIDTRNGYLYGHLIAETAGGESYNTIYRDADRPIQEQWGDLRQEIAADLSRLLAEERQVSSELVEAVKAPPATESAPPP